MLAGSPARSFAMSILGIGDNLQMRREYASLVLAGVVDVPAFRDGSDPQLKGQPVCEQRDSVTSCNLTVPVSANAACPDKTFLSLDETCSQAVFKGSSVLRGERNVYLNITDTLPASVMGIAQTSRPRWLGASINRAGAKVLGSHRGIVHLERSGV